ncbi:tetratricopeptide repeat protein [soil metagenome]
MGSSASAQAPLDSLLAAGIAELQRGQTEVAAQMLSQAFEMDGAHLSAPHGSVALWTGRAYEARGPRGADRGVWEHGLRLQVAAARDDPTLGIDPQLFDAYFRRAYESTPDERLIHDAYVKMLRRMDVSSGEAETTTVQSFLTLAELAGWESESNQPVDHEARALAEWWERSNPAPGTGINVRLVEHLRRAAYARTAYPSAQSILEIDGRGEVYVRYGPPSRRTIIRIESATFVNRITNSGGRILLSEFPPNEVWAYDHLSREAIFLFVRDRVRGAGYSIGSVNDLLPRSLRNSGSVLGGGRGAQFASLGLASVAYFLRELSLFHPAYGIRADRLSNYAFWLEEQEIAESLDVSIGTPVADFGSPAMTMGRAVETNGWEDSRLTLRREASMPVAHYDDAGERPVTLRARPVRTLAADGATEVSIYWAAEAPTTDVTMPADVSLLQQAQLLRYSDDLASHDVAVDTSYAITIGTSNVMAVRQTMAADGDNFVLQVSDLIALSPHDPAGVLLGQSVYRIDNLNVLATEGLSIEMSDLLPFHVGDVVAMGDRLRQDFTARDLSPYLQPSLVGREALGIYFEIYDMTGHRGDYLIYYQVVKRRDGNILRGSREDTTIFQSQRHFAEQRRPAAFLLDHTQWTGADEVEIIVTILDPDSGDSVERSVTFDNRR